MCCKRKSRRSRRRRRRRGKREEEEEPEGNPQSDFSPSAGRSPPPPRTSTNFRVSRSPARFVFLLRVSRRSDARPVTYEWKSSLKRRCSAKGKRKRGREREAGEKRGPRWFNCNTLPASREKWAVDSFSCYLVLLLSFVFFIFFFPRLSDASVRHSTSACWLQAFVRIDDFFYYSLFILF